jgi:hypothetical protein
MKQLSIFLLLSILFSFSSCKKSRRATISGKAINKANGDPARNFLIYFETTTPPKYPWNHTSTSYEVRATDSNGNFTFNDVDINENSGYHYELYGYNCTSYKCNDMTSVSIDKSNILSSYELKVLPRFWSLSVCLDTNSSLTYPDSVAVIIKNKVNSPYIPTIDTLTSSSLKNGKFFSIDDGIASKWYFNIFKKKNNISSYSGDSIYMNTNFGFTYTVNY